MTKDKAILGKSSKPAIAARYRKAVAVKAGEKVPLVLEEGETRRAIQRAQMLVRLYIPKERRLSEELLQERRKELRRA